MQDGGMCMPAVPKMHATTLKFLWLIMCTSKIHSKLSASRIQCPTLSTTCSHDQHYTSSHDQHYTYSHNQHYTSSHDQHYTSSHDQHYTSSHNQHYTSSHDQHYTSSHDQNYCGSNSSCASTNLKQESHMTF